VSERAPAGPLSQALLSACARDRAAALAQVEGLESTLRSIIAEARKAWPELPVGDEEFLRHLAPQLPADAPERAIASLHAADLFFALACLQGIPKATEELNRRIRVGPLAAIARQLGARAPIDEVHGRLLQRLLMADGGRGAKLAEYSGRGPLDAWLQVVALRVALNLSAPNAREVPLDETLLADDGPATGHPELDLLRARFRGDFRKAVHHAVAALSPRDRTVLRLSIVDGLNIDAIGRTFGVHRATVARWIAAAREQIIGATRDTLRANLKLKPTELDSLLGLADSQLDVSLSRILR